MSLATSTHSHPRLVMSALPLLYVPQTVGIGLARPSQSTGERASQPHGQMGLSLLAESCYLC
jgi:hypothetical protein